MLQTGIDTWKPHNWISRKTTLKISHSQKAPRSAKRFHFKSHKSATLPTTWTNPPLTRSNMRHHRSQGRLYCKHSDLLRGVHSGKLLNMVRSSKLVAHVPPPSSIWSMSEISFWWGPVPPGPPCPWGWAPGALVDGGPSGVPGPCHWPHMPAGREETGYGFTKNAPD